MTGHGYEKDLVVLTPDTNWRIGIQSLLSQHQKLDIRRISFEFRHRAGDGGCRSGAGPFLARESTRFSHALVLFDREGCGEEQLSVEELESRTSRSLAPRWGDRAAVVVVDPELEAWVWSDSIQVDAALGWRGRQPTLREWLMQEDFLLDGQMKPRRPKEAMEKALRVVEKQRTSAIFASLAASVSFGRCEDAAFLRLRRLLQTWFPPG